LAPESPQKYYKGSKDEDLSYQKRKRNEQQMNKKKMAAKEQQLMHSFDRISEEGKRKASTQMLYKK
jgi:hypothetical protein